MINKSSSVANIVFYIGLLILGIFTTVSLTLIFDPSQDTTSIILIFFFGIVPAAAGVILTYLGLYMRDKNRRRKFRTR